MFSLNQKHFQSVSEMLAHPVQVPVHIVRSLGGLSRRAAEYPYGVAKRAVHSPSFVDDRLANMHDHQIDTALETMDESRHDPDLLPHAIGSVVRAYARRGHEGDDPTEKLRGSMEVAGHDKQAIDEAAALVPEFLPPKQ